MLQVLQCDYTSFFVVPLLFFIRDMSTTPFFVCGGLRGCGNGLTTGVDDTICDYVVFLFGVSLFLGFLGGCGFGGRGRGGIGDGGDTWFTAEFGFGTGTGGFLGIIGACGGLDA